MAEINYISIDEARDIHLATIRNSGGGDCGAVSYTHLDVYKRQLHGNGKCDRQSEKNHCYDSYHGAFLCIVCLLYTSSNYVSGCFIIITNHIHIISLIHTLAYFVRLVDRLFRK